MGVFPDDWKIGLIGQEAPELLAERFVLYQKEIVAQSHDLDRPAQVEVILWDQNLTVDLDTDHIYLLEAVEEARIRYAVGASDQAWYHELFQWGYEAHSSLMRLQQETIRASGGAVSRPWAYKNAQTLIQKLGEAQPAIRQKRQTQIAALWQVAADRLNELNKREAQMMA